MQNQMTGAHAYPLLNQIQETAERLSGKILFTPTWCWQTGAVETLFSESTELWLKLELLQKTGSFKLRGALTCLNALDLAARQRGIVAVSAGNHAMAVAYVGHTTGTSTTVIMPQHANPARVLACRKYGATVLLMPDVHQAFQRGRQIELEEGRTMLHPYDGPLTALGTATVGLELMRQVDGLDAVVVPIGGGGLCAGISAAVKQINPKCKIYGVEPFGADIMFRSFQSGSPEGIAKVETIADSLGAPYALPYSMQLCQMFVDELVRVSDEQICRAMYYLYRDVKLVAEPAAATAVAGIFGPLHDKLDGKRIGVIVCGSNIDPATYAGLLSRGELST